MADTGAPWNLPYPIPTDLVRDGADAIKDLAEATADSLNASGGLVEVKHVIKTDTFVSGSVSGGGNALVTDLEITHEVADPANRLIISAYFGAAAANTDVGSAGIAINEFTAGGTPENVLIGVGDADGSRTRVGSGGQSAGVAGGSNRIAMLPSVMFVHTPGAGEKTYSVRVMNLDSTASTLYVNRPAGDVNSPIFPRASSALVIQEVKV